MFPTNQLNQMFLMNQKYPTTLLFLNYPTYLNYH
jgi:hypothetical protein